MKREETIAVLIAAAGSGSRMGLARPKQYMEIDGVAMVERTMRAFAACPAITELWLAVPPEDVGWCRERYEPLQSDLKLRGVLPGGATRQQTVAAALAAIGREAPVYLLIQDAARPFTDRSLIDRVVGAMRETGAAVPGVPVHDTIKRVTSTGTIGETPDRTALMAAQTPQGFAWPLIRRAYEEAEKRGWMATDDSGLVERLGHPVRMVEGDVDNRKITTPADLPSPGRCASRIGVGYDVHRLAPNRKLVLGGVTIDHPVGLLGHSDADVVIHAMIDALLGAAGLGDIGRRFPDSDPAYEGISSLILLERTGRILAEEGFAIGNLDVVVMAESPKIAPYSAGMCRRCAEALAIPGEKVSIKGTTTEGLGFIGRGEGIAAQAVAGLIRRG